MCVMFRTIRAMAIQQTLFITLHHTSTPVQTRQRLQSQLRCRVAVSIQPHLNGICMPPSFVSWTLQPPINIVERTAKVTLERLLVARGPLLLILHPKVNPASPCILRIRSHLFWIITESLGTPRQRIRRPNIIVIPRKLNGTPPIENLGSLHISRQRPTLLHLRNRIAHAPLGRFERRLTIRIIRRVLIHHARRTHVINPIVHIIIARLAVHLPIHLLPISAREVLSARLEVVRFVCGIPQKGGEFVRDVMQRAHRREFFRVEVIVIVDGFAQSLVRVWECRIGCQEIEFLSCQYIARTGNIRI
mmetsp:Transcript_6409/g.13959  ORF Transcript_6409/g.13959 Transcript_6409/m.13959 type:complete len:304 (-) Transcript_6409:924-1835(-)